MAMAGGPGALSALLLSSICPPFSGPSPNSHHPLIPPPLDLLLKPTDISLPTPWFLGLPTIPSHPHLSKSKQSHTSQLSAPLPSLPLTFSGHSHFAEAEGQTPRGCHFRG